MNDKSAKKQNFPKPKVIDQLNEDGYKIPIFRAAMELEVWAKVAAGENTAVILAEKEDWDVHGTQVLLDDLCALKLLKKRGNRYGLTTEAEYFLLPDKPTYQVSFLKKEFQWEGNGQLAKAIRTGKRPIHYKATKDDAADIWIGFYACDWADPQSYLESANALWKTLKIRPRTRLRILDIACGPAPKTFALAMGNPGVRITLVDWGQVLKTSLEFADKLGVKKQVITNAGNLFAADFGSNKFDLAFLGNITHFLNPEENMRLFQKTYGALVHRGLLALDAHRHEYPNPAGPELWFYAVSKGGAAYSFQEYKVMLEQAGFTKIEDVAKRPIKAVKS